MIDTPQLDKMLEAIGNGSQEIGAFLDWLLNETGLVLCEWTETYEEVDCKGMTRDGGPSGMFDGSNCDQGEVKRHSFSYKLEFRVGDECPRCDGTGVRKVKGDEGFVPDRRGVQQLLADYFEVDLDALEQERRAVLERQRELNETHGG